MIHSNDIEWAKNTQQYLSDPNNNFTEDFLSQLYFRILPSRWPLISRNTTLKELILQTASCPYIDPCSMLLTVIERLPLIPTVFVFRDSFKELILQIVVNLLLSESRINLLMQHCTEDSTSHPPTDIIIRGMFRVREILTNALGYCPKVLADPVYYGTLYRIFFNLTTFNSTLTSFILQNGIVYNKLQYCFPELFKAWNLSLKDKLKMAVKELSEVNLDTVILKIFEYFHSTNDCSKELALNVLKAFCPQDLELLTIKKLMESKHFSIREANLLLDFLYVITPMDKIKVLFTACSDTWGNKNFAIIAPYNQQRCKFI